MSVLSAAVYVSSGAASVARAVAARASQAARVAVVDVFSDEAYARSSVKLVGEQQALVVAASAAAVEAFSLVDLSLAPHPAPHPRCGALDMVAFMPCSDAAGRDLRDELSDCDALAWELGAALAGLDASVLMFGARAGRSLVQTRRGTAFFASLRADAPSAPAATTFAPDFGPAVLTPSRGVCVVGSMPYVTNFNVQVEGATLEQCRAAASALRREHGVQLMALPHEGGSCELGCNLQASASAPAPRRAAILESIARALPAGARVLRSYVVGLTPGEARARGVELLARLDEASTESARM